MSVRDHKQLQIVPGDTVVISATPIPGNEKSVHKTINNLYKLGATVIHGTDGRSHVSGHASQEELLADAQPRAPRVLHAGARRVPHAGSHTDGWRCRPASRPRTCSSSRTATCSNSHASTATKSAQTYGGNVLVDGSGIGDVGEAVLRDRKALSNDGIMIVVVAIDAEEARVIGGPDLISKGVFYLPESDGVLDELRTELRNAIAQVSVEAIRDVNSVKEHIRTTLARAINRRTKRRPVIIPVVMEV